MIMTMTNAQLAAKVQELEAWKESIIADLREEANDRGWCEEFDRFMKDHGVVFPPQPHEAEVAATVNFTIKVDASDSDTAEEILNGAEMEQAVRDAAIEQIRGHGFDDLEVTEVSKV